MPNPPTLRLTGTTLSARNPLDLDALALLDGCDVVVVEASEWRASIRAREAAENDVTALIRSHDAKSSTP
jgi:hypothetical protein